MKKITIYNYIIIIIEGYIYSYVCRYVCTYARIIFLNLIDMLYLLFLSGPSHPSEIVRFMVSIPTCCLSGSVGMLGWPCRCRGWYHCFNNVCMYVSVGWWYFFYKFFWVMARVSLLFVCMYVVVVFSLCMISLGVFVCSSGIILIMLAG